MKKIIASLLLLLISGTIYARDTNYSTADECINDVVNYAWKATDNKQATMSRWFNSFAHDSGGKIDNGDGTVTIYTGCRFIASKDHRFWNVMRAKLDQQIAQLNAGLPSLYGDKASIICNFSTTTHKIDLDSCH